MSPSGVTVGLIWPCVGVPSQGICAPERRGRQKRYAPYLFMKSIAFRLAFKVHRNELSFEEGIIRSNAHEAGEDFLEALNSLAGEMKYDPAALPLLLRQAQRSVETSVAAAPDTTALEEQIDNLRQKKQHLQEGIQTLKMMSVQSQPTVIPGINSILLLVTSGVLVALLFVFKYPLLGLLAIVMGLAGAGVFLVNDFRVKRRQQEEAQRRRAKNEEEIKRLSDMLQEIGRLLEAKLGELRSIRGG